MLELREMEELILIRDRLLWAYGVQCTIGCSRFASSHKVDNVGRIAEELGKR
jgi:hypothetical protein